MRLSGGCRRETVGRLSSGSCREAVGRLLRGLVCVRRALCLYHRLSVYVISVTVDSGTSPSPHHHPPWWMVEGWHMSLRSHTNMQINMCVFIQVIHVDCRCHFSHCRCWYQHHPLAIIHRRGWSRGGVYILDHMKLCRWRCFKNIVFGSQVIRFTLSLS